MKIDILSNSFKNVSLCVFKSALITTVLVSQSVQAGFKIELKPLAQKQSAKAPELKPFSIKDIPALPPKSTVIRPTIVPALPPKAVVTQPNSAPTLSPVSASTITPTIAPSTVQNSSAPLVKPNVVGRDIISTFADGSPQHVSLVLRTCFSAQRAVGMVGKLVTFSDGELFIKSRINDQGCFDWYQDIYLDQIQAQGSKQSTGGMTVSDEYFKYLRLVRWLKIEGSGITEALRVDFFINPFLSTTIDGSLKIDSTKILNDRNMSFSGESFN